MEVKGKCLHGMHVGAYGTVGMFQVESRAQMASLPRNNPEKFYDVVVQVAIIRPGPIVGKMMHPYMRRRQKKEDISYPHPSLEPVLKRTLGVPLFQEQLLRMAMVVARLIRRSWLILSVSMKRSSERKAMSISCLPALVTAVARPWGRLRKSTVRQPLFP
jgi:error-prone DNA polymerase